MANTITLNGDYGYTQYRYNNGTADAIDATNATWTVANSGSQTNLYPFLVDNAKTGIDVYGATIDGTVPMTGEWLKLYTNSAAFMVRDSAQADIYDLRISDAWDAIRVAGNSDGFEISNVWVSDVRDDAFENDNPVSGSISDSLFDGVFSGISLGHKNMANASNEVLTLDNVLIRMESYLFKGEMTHQSPFKMESKSPKLSITDSVIAIDDVNHVGQSRLQLAWNKTIESSNNVFLNLSDTPLPSNYPTPPAGWTVLQGQAARDYWDAAQQEWLDSRGESSAPTDTVVELAPEAETVVSEPVVNDPVVSEPVVSEPSNPTASAPADTGTASDLSAGVTMLDSGKIQLDGAVFASLQQGTLREAHFEVAARADDADDYVMYKWKTGELFYDADGRGGADQVKIGQLDSRLSLDNSDFVVTPAEGATTETASDPAPAAASAPAPATTGTSGADIFLFDSLPTDGAITEISAFDPGSDKIQLDSSIFTALQGSQGEVLGASNFEVAARADDMNDHIMYKWKTGELFYDPDGRGPESQIEIAQLEDRMSLDHTDFLII